MAANGYAVLIVRVVQLCEYIKNHGSACFTWVNYISIKLFFLKKRFNLTGSINKSRSSFLRKCAYFQ